MFSVVKSNAERAKNATFMKGNMQALHVLHNIKMIIRESLFEYENELIKIRRYLHENPELSFKEKGTCDYILQYLKKLNPSSLVILANTGVKAVFKGYNPKKTICFRADIDALPMEEKNQCEYASKNPGVMHACGHDGHIAMALVLAKIISKNKLDNNIVVIFQPGEESSGGALPMIKEGVLKNPEVDEVYGLHLMPFLQAGKIGLKNGNLMATVRDFDVEIYGKSAHGAKPQQGIDAIVAASYFIAAVQSIVSRNINPLETAVVTIGKVTGGQARNIICSKVVLEGTMRAYSEDVMQLIKNKLTSILKGMEVMYNVNTNYCETKGYPTVKNPKVLYDKVKNLLEEEEFENVEPLMISEDFSYYQKETQGFFAFLGIQGEKEMELHTNLFNFEEKCLLHGVEYFLRIALDD